MLRKIEKNLLLGAGIWYFGEGMLGPLFAVFTQKIGGDILDISSAWATFLIVTGVLSVLVGKVSDSLSKKKIMLAGYFLNAVFTFSYLFVSNPAHLFLVQAGLGLAVALAAPTWNALYANYEDRTKAGFLWGLADGGFRIVTGIAIIIGGVVVNFLSFQTLFITMGVIQTLAAIYQAKILKYN